MNVCPYTRVSGLGQVERDGPERQSESILAFCSRNNLTPTATFFEKAVSGTIEGMERPEFANMVLYILKRRDEASKLQSPAKEALWIDGIVVEKFDRLARTTMVQELIVRELRKNNIKLFVAEQPFIDYAAKSEDPERELLRQIMGVIAEWDKSNTVKRLAHGRANMRRALGRCEGAKPYGEKPGEETPLAKMKEWRAMGWSYADIAVCLNAENFRTRFGRAWTWAHVSDIINNWRAKRRKSKIRSQEEIAKL